MHHVLPCTDCTKTLCRLAAWAALMLLAGSRTVAGGELYLEFLEGLRARDYHDYAVLYLDQLQSKSDLPADVRAVLDFEKAVTLLAGAKATGDVKTQQAQLDEAESLLERFVKAQPDHSKAAQAKIGRARILFEKGRVASRRSRVPTNRRQKDQLRREARKYIAEARQLFRQVHDAREAEWEKYKGYIDRGDTQLIAERDRVEADYIWLQIYLAQSSYEQARTFDPQDAEFDKWMSQAAEQFGRIHEVYRSQAAGLHGRLWQGKSFEQLGEIGKALGIFNELLDHPGESPIIERVQDQALEFRLGCLNHTAREDYRLVVDEATEWLNENDDKSNSLPALGIRWQRARALEELSEVPGLTDSQRERHLQQALQDARDVNRAPGDYKQPSQAMIQRMQVALGRDPSDPKDFDGAFELARNMVSEVSAVNQALADVDNARERSQLEEDLRLQLGEAARMLRLALNLADERTAIERVNQVRYMLAWANYLAGESYRAAILGEYLARHAAAKDSQMALDAAYLALAAWLKAYNEAPGGQRDVERERMRRVGELMNLRWPKAERTNEARMNLGQVFAAAGDPVEAAHWYAQVPETSPEFAAAQLAAGQSYWKSYLQAAAGDENERPSADELESWQQSARRRLGAGIKSAQDTPADPASPAANELIAGKASLAQIHINSGEYAQAIALLTEGPNAVMDLIRAANGSGRSASGVHSREFAAICYQLLLRAYVGTQQIDRALEVMQQLEQMAGAAGTEGVAAVYVQLGREIEKEIERLVAQDRTERLSEVRASFDRFLSGLFDRKGEMSYSSLIWIAETYFGLAEGMRQQSPAESHAYFAKAAETYKDILARSELAPGRATAVKLRLASCLRRQERFAEALERLREVLDEKPRLLDAQFEAAALLQDWGASDSPGGSEKLLEAINGRDEAGVWGWGELSVRLQRLLDSPHEKPEHKEKFFQARYNISACRRQYALSATDSAKRKQAQEAAMQEIEAVAYLIADVEDQWKSKLNRLYRDIQRDLNVPRSAIADIDWPDGGETRTARLADGSHVVDTESVVAAPAEGQPAQPSVSMEASWGLAVAGVIVAVCAAVLIIYVLAVGNRRWPAQARLGPSTGSLRSPGPAKAAAAAGGKKAAKPSRPKSERATSSSRTTDSTRSKTRRK